MALMGDLPEGRGNLADVTLTDIDFAAVENASQPKTLKRCSQRETEEAAITWVYTM